MLWSLKARAFLSAVVGLFAWLWSTYLLRFAETANGYGSKVACTCHFIQNRTLESVAERELTWPPIALFVRLESDPSTKCVVSRLKWLPSIGVRRACMSNDKRLGCSIVSRHKTTELSARHSGHGSKDIEVNDDTDVFRVSPEHQIQSSLLDDHMKDDWLHSRALLVVNATSFPAQILYERYGDGMTASTPQAGWSMTKSLFAMLVGALQMYKQDAFPLGLETRALEDGTTVEQLLRMVDGLDWDEVYSAFTDPVNMLFLDENATTSISKKRASVGKCFRYSSKSSNLLSRWIRSLFPSDQEYHDFPFKVLFSRINARSAIVERDPAGTFVASSFSMMTARDWARLGILLAREGSWPVLIDGYRREEQIIPKSFVRALRSVTPTSRAMYGLHFWLGGGSPTSTESEDRVVRECDELYRARVSPSRAWYHQLPKETFFMTGFEGQYVIVDPVRKLVVVRLGASKEQMPGWKVFLPGELFPPLLNEILSFPPERDTLVPS